MAIALVDSDVVGFADGDTPGHVYTFPAGAPSVGDLDVLCINSNTVVSTPSGFTSRVSAVANQGSYVFTRKASGGEGSSVTVVTSGNENTTLTWSRWSGTDAYSAGNSAQANNSNGTTLPAASTGTLAATGMLVLAFAALHNHDGALATSPVWSNSFNALEAGSQGAAGASSSCVAFTGYKTNAGTASETINSVSWTNNVRNRYALWVAFTAAAAGGNVTGTATGESGFTAPAAGKRTVLGTATLATGFTAPSIGTRIVKATATGSFGFSAPATGQGISETVTGTATGTFGFTAPVTGLRTVRATATGFFGFTSTAMVDEAIGAGPRITASTPVGRITATTPGGRL